MKQFFTLSILFCFSNVLLTQHPGCDDPIVLQCDAPVTVEPGGEVLTNIYEAYCNLPYLYSGPEVIHVFTPSTTGLHDVLIEILDISQDLDIFILEDCLDPSDCVASATGTTAFEIISEVELEAGQDYYIIVDGYEGASSAYTILVGCPSENNFPCDDNGFIACNDEGDEYISDSNNANSNLYPDTQATDLLDQHDDCDNVDDGCDSGNDYNEHSTTGNEILYEVVSGAGNLVLDLHWSSSSDDLDLFLYEQCDDQGPFGCLASSTYGGTNFQSVILENSNAGDALVAVVDGQNSGDETNFTFSVTCGDIDDHNPESLACGIPVQGDTSGSKNYNSFYCNCQDQTRNDGRQNYGKEDVYEFTIDASGTTSIILEILDPTIDLNLYLLNDEDVFECNRASDSQTPGETERIDFEGSASNMLPPGDYIIVVDGFRGDEGPYRLTLEHVTCMDPCENSQALSCERFETYQEGDLIIDQANWEQGANGDVSCIVRDDGDNIYLAVDQENFIVCASRYTFPQNTDPDATESVSFDLYLPFGEGFSCHINESVNDDFIFFNMVDYFGSGSTALNFSVNDKVTSLNGDYEPFDYPYDQWFRFELTLDKANETMTVFINDQLVFSETEIEVLDIVDIAFDANLTNQGGNGLPAKVDNLCQDACMELPPENPCTMNTFLYCDDFEQCSVNDAVNDKKNWDDSFFPGQLYVQSDNGNEYMALKRDGQDDAGATFIVPTHAGQNQVEIFSFNAWIPAEGGMSTLYEADNGQTMFLDFIHSNSEGPQFNLGISNVYYTMNVNGGSYISAAFTPNMWFEIQIQIDRSNGNLELYFDDTFVLSIANTGIDAFKSIEFTSALSNNKETKVDDICLSTCSACVLPYFEIISCEQIQISFTEPAGNDEIEVNLSADSNLDIQYWEIWNQTDGFTDQLNTTDHSISTLFLVGNQYQVCVYYFDENGCLIKCCLDDLTSADNEKIDGLKVFPNPVVENLNIQSDHQLAYKFMSIDGQVLLSGLTTRMTQINTQDFHAGIYILKLSDLESQAATTVKILKQ